MWISIHTLRAEGDVPLLLINKGFQEFQSTPSGRRVTELMRLCKQVLDISIHTLRAEGDSDNII